MSDILFIKTSSLGDVIHHMPALTEARRHRPGARFSWIVEESYAPLVRLHPAVAEVIPVASRRWRTRLHHLGTWREMRDVLRQVRTHEYAEVIDTQGLLRSALIARSARGRRHGYDAKSIREPMASLFYDVRHAVGFHLHAIERNRILTARALDYAPAGEIDYGLDRGVLAASPGGGYGVFLHATAMSGKEWPEEHWIALGKAMSGSGNEIVLPWGTPSEQARSERIASSLAHARIPQRQPLDAVARLIAGASFIVGVDTGLLHLAAALSVPLVAIFVGSEPGLTGPAGSGRIAIVGAKASRPSVEEVVAAVSRIMKPE